MNPRITFIFVAVAALLLGYVLLVEAPRTPESLGTPAPTVPRVFDLKGGEVKTLELRDLRQGRELKMTRADSGWKIQTPQERPADAFKVDALITDLAGLAASRVLTNAIDLAQYGMVTATLEVRMIMSDTTAYAITIGSKTPDGSSYYAIYTGATEKVFIVGTRVVDQLLAWFDQPPYEPTATPTLTATPPVTPTLGATQPATATPPAASPTPTATPTAGSG